MAESTNTGCCPKGSEPALAANYKALGTVSKIEDLPIYTVGEGKKSAIVLNYDIYGFDGGRTKLICDQLAAEGHFVILPDYYRGESFPVDAEVNVENLTPFVHTYPWEKLQADLEGKVLPFLKEKGFEKIGALGFCWGAWINLNISGTGKLDCAANAHPSFNAENFFGKSEVELAKRVQCPQLIFAAGNDLPNIKEGGEIVNLLKEKTFGDKCVFREFPDVVHGFASRGELEKPEVASAVKEFIEGVTQFFKANLA
mmetsp:Transcript_59090/g.67283  ORF Transcript_59090/g.67283 Transcript_59090/m.67283 type:complete len:256 (+) Transcript_59090:44-811(+)